LVVPAMAPEVARTRERVSVDRSFFMFVWEWKRRAD
jgi:hypothetical protein